MIRRPLGRGLDALIDNTTAEAASPVGAAQIVMAPLGNISPNPFQPRLRFDEERLQELARAISSQGVIEPLVVRPSAHPGNGAGPQFELIAGERRLRAAKAAGLDAVPVIVRELDDRGALEMSLVENLAREELNPVEEGRAFLRLSREFSLSHDEIAARIGKSRPYVSNAIRLLDLPVAVLELIARGALSAGQARPLLALGSAEARIAAARKIVERGITARGAEEIASAHRRRRSGASARTASDPNLNALAEGLQRALRRKVRILRRRGRTPGRIEIEYYDDSDLTALAAALAVAMRPAAAHA
jgi:ParB family transcriptional regulator, chromosome partitioning protein